MNRKPRVGTLLLSSGWFHDVGMQSDQLTRAIDRAAAEIVERLTAHVEVVFPREVHSLDEAHKAVEAFNRSDIDLLLVCYLTWTEDQPLQAVIDRIKPTPILLWCFTPFETLPEVVNSEQMLLSSGGVGALQSSGLLRRRDMSCGFVLGGCRDDRVMDQIINSARAAATRSDLRLLNIGIIPSPCDQMSTTFVDDFKLRNELGPSLKYFSIQQYKEVIDGISDDAIQPVLKDIRNTYRVASEIAEESLSLSLRASLALDRLAVDHQLGAIALNDVSDELHQRIGLRPGLRLPGMFQKEDLVVAMEADVGAAVAMYIARRISGKPCLYAEPLTYDLATNTLVMGHAGLLDAAIAAGPEQIRIIPDFEYKNSDRYPGAVNHFVGDLGQVTLTNCVYNGRSFQMVALRGESVGTSWVLQEGYSHMAIRPQIAVEDFFRRNFEIGVSQHWIVVHGDWCDQLQKLCSMSSMDFYVLL